MRSGDSFGPKGVSLSPVATAPAAASGPASAPASSIILLGAADSLLLSGARPAPATRFDQLQDALASAIMAGVSGAELGHLCHALDAIGPSVHGQSLSRAERDLVDHLRGAIVPLLKTPATWEVGWHCAGLARLAENASAYDINTVSRSIYSGDTGVGWKTFSDGYYDQAASHATYDALHAAGVIPRADKPFRFVSASANSATHEVAMYERDVERNPDRVGRTFLVGDIADVPKRAYPGPTYPRGELFHLQWDASALPLAPGSVDVIWDRKGRLWFTLTSDKLEGKATPLGALGVLDHYAAILRPGGHIVVDAIEGFDAVASAAGLGTGRATAIHYLRNGGQLPEGVTPQAEPSTVDAINSVVRDSNIDLMALIATRFEVSIVGEGKSRCLVFKKPLVTP